MSIGQVSMNSVKSNVIVKPFGARQQAIVSLGDTHFVMGSSMIHDTVSQSSRPIDLLLATLATDCTFACQEAAPALGIPLHHLTTTAQWVDGTHSHAEIRFGMNGPDTDQSNLMIAFVKNRCQTYKLLSPVLTITLKAVI